MSGRRRHVSVRTDGGPQRAENARARRNQVALKGQQHPRGVEPETTHKLQKVLAQAGLGSRREMEIWIQEGKVTVNGLPAKLGARVGPRDEIRVGRRIIRAQPAGRLPRILIYHKPEGEITSRADPQGRPSVFAQLPPAAGAKWIAIGRLDFNTCGLLVFTTSGELANRIMHPRFEIEREYAVRLRGQLRPEHVQQLQQGVTLPDGVARCEKIEPRGGEGANQWWHVVLKEGRNRIVRRIFEALGFTVSRLMRVRFGIIALPPQLRRGQFRELSAEETQQVLDWLDVPPAETVPHPARGAGVRG